MESVNDVLHRLGYRVSVKVPAKPPRRGNNKFYWWRRYPTHKTSSKYTPIEDRIKNGDFDYSPYWRQIEYEYYWLATDIVNAQKQPGWCVEKERDIRTVYSKRIQRLSEDAMKDEHERFEAFIDALKWSFGGSREDIKDFVNTFEGTILECVTHYKIKLQFSKKKKVDDFFERTFLTE